MKKLLYFTTIFFNTIGTLICTNLIFTLGTKYENLMPIIFISFLLFIVSLSVTISEINKDDKNNIIYLNTNTILVLDLLHDEGAFKRSNIVMHAENIEEEALIVLPFLFRDPLR